MPDRDRIEQMDAGELLDAWDAPSRRRLYARGAAAAAANGELERRRLLEETIQTIDGRLGATSTATASLAALAANACLIRRLAGWQWIEMRYAREAGASWDEVAAALGLGDGAGEQARARYVAALDRQERYAGDMHKNPEVWRAVVDDLPAGTR